MRLKFKAGGKVLDGTTIAGAGKLWDGREFKVKDELGNRLVHKWPGSFEVLTDKPAPEPVPEPEPEEKQPRKKRGKRTGPKSFHDYPNK